MAVRVLFSPWRIEDEYVSVTPEVPFAGIEQTQVSHEHALYRNPNRKAVWSYSGIHSRAY